MVTINASGNSISLYYANADYNTTKTNLSSSGTDPGRVGQLHWGGGGGYYSISRYMAIFDTSGISLVKTIAAARFKGRITAMGVAHVETLRLMNGQPGAPENPPIATDYNEALYAGDGGEIDTSGWGAPPFTFSLDLNPTGIGWIQKGGITKLCWRSSKDIAGTPPPNNTDETWYFDTVQLDIDYLHDIANEPYVFITGEPLSGAIYEPPNINPTGDG